MPVRVTLINDDEITTRGVAAMLREHPGEIELVSLVGPTLTPIDVALYDHTTNEPGVGPSLAELVADARIRKVVVFTWSFQPWHAADFLRQGASAYLSKRLTGRELVDAIRRVDADRVLVSAGGPGGRHGHPAENGESLTEREAQVLSLISNGLANNEIAEKLTLSINSVKSYIRSCYRKIDVESRTQAVLWGLGHGLGNPPADDEIDDRESPTEAAWPADASARVRLVR